MVGDIFLAQQLGHTALLEESNESESWCAVVGRGVAP